MKKTDNNTPPVVEIQGFGFEQSEYQADGRRYKAATLYKEVEKEGVKPFDLPLAGLDISKLGFRVDDLDDFVFLMKRTLNVDLNIPIILDWYGRVADGYHRVCRALLEGKSTIKAYRLQEPPYADYIEKED